MTGNIRSFILLIRLTFGSLLIIALGLGILCVYVTDVLIAISLLAGVLFVALAIFSRMLLIKWYIRNGKYPFEFVVLVENLQIVRSIDIDLAVYERKYAQLPFYSTEEFLRDNSLLPRVYSRNGNIAVVFTDDMIIVNTFSYSWDLINDWTFKAGGEDGYDSMLLHYRVHDEAEYLEINLNELDSDRLDFTLLLIHFKGKNSIKQTDDIKSIN